MCLSQEHEATMVGILLGLAVAKRGSMDGPTSKMLFLHVPARCAASVALSLHVSARFKVSECPWVGDCQPPRAQVPQMRILHEPAKYAAAVYVRWRLQYHQVMPGMTTRDTAGLALRI